ncbi:unnamed protein product [Caenorhabditis brenneri]
MSTYIQVNIYNQTLDVLKSRGLNLKDILKTIGCPDTWITEVPIPPSNRNRLDSPSVNSKKPSLTSASLASSVPTEDRSSLKKPFKSISAEIGFCHPLDLISSVERNPSPSIPVSQTSQTSSNGKLPTVLGGLFDDWDPTANLDVPETTSSIPADPILASDGLKTPKEEIIDEEDERTIQGSESFEMNDTEMANQQEINMINELFRQQNNFGTEPLNSDESGQTANKGRKRNEEPEALNYVIECNYPGCGLRYNWRVKYGKLRLLDHALTHSNRKIPCKLCGFECTNVRKMRSHYGKAHPNERVEGYGMKALVSGDCGKKDGTDTEHDQQVSEDELKELWNACYSESLHLVGHATGFVEGEKYRRMTKRRKMERDAINSVNSLF